MQAVTAVIGEVLSAGKQIFSRGNFGGKTTRSSLSVDIKSREDDEVYTCRAYNDLGEALDAVTLAIACECPLDRAGLSITKHTTRTRSMNKFSITHSRVWTRGAIIPVIISNFSIDRQFIYLSNLFFY